MDDTTIVDLSDKYIWRYIDRISKEDPYQVFNLTVEEDHTYIANGAIVHNCGGNASMLALDPDGRCFPCIRYMESSLGNEVEPIIIGDVYNGVMATQKQCDWVDCMKCVDRRTQSTDECFYCPIASGCAWCSAYNYQETGSIDKRVTYICEMHKARCLANYYHWKRVYAKRGKGEKMSLNVPKEWALEIISEEEYIKLTE